MNPKIFGWQHLVYLAVFISLSVVGLILIKKYCKSKKAKSIAVYITAGLLLISVIINRISQCKSGFDWKILFPDTWCSTTSYVLALFCLLIPNRNSSPFHFIIYLALLGPSLTMIYPDFIGQNPSVFYLPTISGLVHHSIALFLAILLIVIGDFKPTIRKWYALPLGAVSFVAYGVFLSNVFGKTKALLVNGESLIEGTPFTWYLVGLILCALVYACTGAIEYIKWNKSKQSSPSQDK